MLRLPPQQRPRLAVQRLLPQQQVAEQARVLVQVVVPVPAPPAVALVVVQRRRVVVTLRRPLLP